MHPLTIATRRTSARAEVQAALADVAGPEHGGDCHRSPVRRKVNGPHCIANLEDGHVGDVRVGLAYAPKPKA